MPRIAIRALLPLILVVLCTALTASAQEAVVVVDGEPRGLAALAELRAAAEEARAALGEAEDEASVARRAVFEAEIEALDAVAALLTRLGAFDARKAELARAVEEARKQLAAARTDAQKPVEFAEMSEERLGELERAAAARNGDLTQADAAADGARVRFEKRRDGLDALAQQITAATAALAAARKAREDEPVAEKHAGLDRRARTAELRLRLLELNRDQHAALLELDTLAAESSKTTAEVARQRRSRAEAELQAARALREAELQREAEESRRAAEAKRREAELADSPTEKAVANLAALVQELGGEAAEENRTESQVKQRLVDAEGDLDWATTHFAFIRRILPDGSDLDAWKVETLREESTNLARRRESIAAKRARAESPELILRRAISQRDRLLSLKGLVERTRDPNLKLDDLPSEAFERYQQLWLAAIRGYHSGLPDLLPFEIDRYRKQLDAQTDALVEKVDLRLPKLESTETKSLRLSEVTAELDEELSAFRRHLESVSLWLRSEPPLASSELVRARDELGRLGDVLADTPTAFGREWRRLSPAVWKVVLALAVIVAAFVFGARLRPRLRRELQAEEFIRGLDFLQRLQRIAAVSLAYAAGPAAVALTALAVERSAPGSPMLVTLAALSGAWVVARISRGANGALYETDASGDRIQSCGDGTARRALRLGTFVALSVPGLFAVSYSLHVGGFTKLAFLTRLTAVALLLSMALWLVVFGRDILALVSPPEGGGALRRAIRAILPVLWPLAFAFFAVVFVLLILGYRNAAWFYGSRSLFCSVAVITSFLAYRVVWAVAARRLGVTPEEAEHDHELSGRVVRPVDLSRRVVRGAILLVIYGGLVAAFSVILDLDYGQWKELGDNVVLPGAGSDGGLTVAEVLKAVLIFWVTLAVARWIRDLLKVVLAERTGTGAGYVIRTLTFYTIAALGVGFSLAALGLRLERIGWFFTAATVGLGFGLQEVVSNFVAGLILFFERPVQVGDVITVGSVEGDVIRINIRSTVVRTRAGISIIIPNKRLITDDVVNWSHGDQRTRLTLDVSVAYGSDVPLVKKLLLEIAETESRALSRPRPEADFIAFGESELQFKLLVWLPHPDITLRRRVTSALNSAIDDAFREHGIEIPFPQRDVHVRSTPRDDDGEAEAGQLEAS